MVESAHAKSDPVFISGHLIKEHDRLKQLLTEAKHKTQMKNLYDHIVEVMDFLIVNYPNDALIKFEEVSYLIKQQDEHKLHQFLRSSASKYNARHNDHFAKSIQPYLDRVAKFYTVSTMIL
jgi:hypothetical protein